MISNSLLRSPIDCYRQLNPKRLPCFRPGHAVHSPPFALLKFADSRFHPGSNLPVNGQIEAFEGAQEVTFAPAFFPKSANPWPVI